MLIPIVILVQVSIFNLLAVAFERYFAIKHPFTYQKYMTIRKAVIVNGIVWALGILFGLIPVFGWNLRSEMTSDWKCNFVTVIDMTYVVYFHFFGCIIIPLIIIVVIYFYIYLVVRKQMSQIAALEISGPNSNQSSKSKFKREIKAAKSLAIVILLFAMCWIPIHILNSISLLCGPDCPYPIELLLFTIVLSHANSAVNPFLYAYGNSNFRRAFEKMFCNKQTAFENVSTIPSSNRVGNNSDIHHNTGRLAKQDSNISVQIVGGNSNGNSKETAKTAKVDNLPTTPVNHQFNGAALPIDLTPGENICSDDSSDSDSDNTNDRNSNSSFEESVTTKNARMEIFAVDRKCENLDMIA